MKLVLGRAREKFVFGYLQMVAGYTELETQWMVGSLDRAIPEIESYLLLRNLFVDDAQKVIQKAFNEVRRPKFTI